MLCHLDNGQGHAAVPVIPGESLEREGDAEAPAVAGEPFQKKWNGRTAWELFGTMASTMPWEARTRSRLRSTPTCSRYLFELNKFPAGQQELTPAREQLESITMVDNPICVGRGAASARFKREPNRTPGKS